MVLTKKRQMFFIGLAFFVGTLAIAWLQQSALWLIGTALSAILILGNMKSLPASKATLFGVDLVLFEALPGCPSLAASTTSATTSIAKAPAILRARPPRIRPSPPR
jgi:hypothetical protein